ncbi:HAD-IIIC family phosphatase [Rhodoblastus sp.]|uniref:HAD-IIIC family phosphatase n=1 Tax=Rhodoblastus sp. TaxID=1962975 RepID=UPI003F944884
MSSSAEHNLSLRLPAGALGLPWLPNDPDWREKLRQAETLGAAPEAWAMLVELASTRMDNVRTIQLDRRLQKTFRAGPPANAVGKPVRLAILGSSTLAHIVPAIRVAGLRRGLWVETYEAAYGQYWQEATNPASGLFSFKPNAVLIAFDARHLLGAAGAALDEAGAAALVSATLDRIAECWRAVKDAFGCQVIQQAALPVFPALMGQNEFRLPGSPRALVERFNSALRTRAETQGVDVLALDARAADDGVSAWHDPTIWYRAKQEVAPVAAPLYGDLVGRLLAAGQGRSAKCLVLDLDNTLWGGVIGDDGLENIVIGQGSALGEAFVAVQKYAKDLMSRGIILAVCSKNDEANALAPFERHPDMALRRSDIACFIANWRDKASNIRDIARTLNIGLDSLVFLDDNPFERSLVRRELPMVAVPEVSDDPGEYPRRIADAGYFEGLSLTEEDRARTAQYRANAARGALQAQATDMDSYLRGLDMRLLWRRFDEIGLKRIAQLINKTNQFNLTTRRYTESEVAAVIGDPDSVGLQFRLVDAFGDNGVIALVIGRRKGRDLWIDTWLMSCRVLGREVEQATLSVIVAVAREMGCATIIGEYIATAKNGMVSDHYAKLGFAPMSEPNFYSLDLARYEKPDLPMSIEESLNVDA